MNKQKGISQVIVMVIMLVLAIALPITTKLVQQSQENRSSAANYSGTCETSCVNNACSGSPFQLGIGSKMEADCLCGASGCNTYYIFSNNTCTPTNSKHVSQLYCTALGYGVCYTQSECNAKIVSKTCTQCSGGTACGEYADGGAPYKCVCSGNSCVGQLAPERCAQLGKTFKSLTSTTGDCVDSTSICPTGIRYYWDGTNEKKCKSTSTASGFCNTSGCGGSYSCYESESGCTDIHGKCGSAAEHDTSSAPTGDGLCSSGSPSSVVDKSTYYQWSCVGSGGSSSATVCNANKATDTTTTCIDGKTLLTDKKWMYIDGSCGTMAVAAKEGCNFCGGSYPCYDTKALCLAAHPITADECTDSNWTSVLSPVACPSNSQQTRTWTKTGTCTGGVTHPSTETVSCTYNASDSVISIKLAFAGVKKDNGKCAVNWPVALKVLNSAGANPLDNVFNAVPTQTTSVNSKGEIVYDYNVTVSNVPTAGASDLAFFLTGLKHISVKYGQNNQNGWYSTSAGSLSLTRGTTNNYDFSNFSLLAGDVNKDGKIDGQDFSYIKEKVNLYLPAAAAGTNVEGDINGDCQANNGDIVLIRQSLAERNEQIY